MSYKDDSLQFIDPRKVRALRQRRGLTESYLGALCGVTSTVIRGIERGRPQEDLSLRFVMGLAAELNVPIHELLTDDYRPPRPEPNTTEDQVADDARALGALLLAVGERLPADAICEVFDWDFTRLDEAGAALAALLEPAGGLLVESDGDLAIADDVCPVEPEAIAAASRAAFIRRRPTVPELRIVVRALEGKLTRLENSDTFSGVTVGRLRTVGLLANADKPLSDKADPPILSDDVRYSLLLDGHDDGTIELSEAGRAK